MDPAPPSQKGGRAPPPIFGPCPCCGQTAAWIKMPLGMKVGLGPGHIVLDGDPAPSKKGEQPQFSAHTLWPNGWMDRDATWYNGRPRPGQHCVRRGLNFTPRGTAPLPTFGSCLLWLSGWMDQDATWYEGRPRPRPHCCMGIQLPPKGAQLPPFSSRAYCGQTVAHLSYC